MWATVAILVLWSASWGFHAVVPPSAALSTRLASFEMRIVRVASAGADEDGLTVIVAPELFDASSPSDQLVVFGGVSRLPDRRMLDVPVQQVFEHFASVCWGKRPSPDAMRARPVKDPKVLKQAIGLMERTFPSVSFIGSVSSSQVSQVHRTPIWSGYIAVALRVASLALLGVLVVMGMAAVWNERRRHRRKAHGQCPRCGYSLAGVTAGRCPECGGAVDSGAA